jgi:nucleoside-diphosphate-sugar epimerase
MILENRTLVVSGVGGGLGREVARIALRDGARVVLAARTEATLETAAAELDPSGERVAWARTDITRAEDCQALASLARERFGAVHALVQVAAYEAVFGGLQDTDFEKWRRAFDTNVVGSLTLLRAVAPTLKQAGGGSVVLIGSQSMYLPLHGGAELDVGPPGRRLREDACQERGPLGGRRGEGHHPQHSPGRDRSRRGRRRGRVPAGFGADPQHHRAGLDGERRGADALTAAARQQEEVASCPTR